MNPPGARMPAMSPPASPDEDRDMDELVNFFEKLASNDAPPQHRDPPKLAPQLPDPTDGEDGRNGGEGGRSGVHRWDLPNVQPPPRCTSLEIRSALSDTWEVAEELEAALRAPKSRRRLSMGAVVDGPVKECAPPTDDDGMSMELESLKSSEERLRRELDVLVSELEVAIPMEADSDDDDDEEGISSAGDSPNGTYLNRKEELAEGIGCTVEADEHPWDEVTVVSPGKPTSCAQSAATADAEDWEPQSVQTRIRMPSSPVELAILDSTGRGRKSIIFCDDNIDCKPRCERRRLRMASSLVDFAILNTDGGQFLSEDTDGDGRGSDSSKFNPAVSTSNDDSCSTDTFVADAVPLQWAPSLSSELTDLTSDYSDASNDKGQEQMDRNQQLTGGDCGQDEELPSATEGVADHALDERLIPTPANLTRKLCVKDLPLTPGLLLQVEAQLPQLTKRGRRTGVVRRWHATAFFEVSLREETDGTKWRSVYRSYPIPESSQPSWDRQEVLPGADLQRVLVPSSQHPATASDTESSSSLSLSQFRDHAMKQSATKGEQSKANSILRIDFYDSDRKRGNHRFIGATYADVRELLSRGRCHEKSQVEDRCLSVPSKRGRFVLKRGGQSVGLAGVAALLG